MLWKNVHQLRANEVFGQPVRRVTEIRVCMSNATARVHHKEDGVFFDSAAIEDFGSDFGFQDVLVDLDHQHVATQLEDQEHKRRENSADKGQDVETVVLINPACRLHQIILIRPYPQRDQKIVDVLIVMWRLPHRPGRRQRFRGVRLHVQQNVDDMRKDCFVNGGQSCQQPLWIELG